MKGVGKRLAALFAAGAAVLATTAAAEPLGRLFYTPAQRAALERMRRTGVAPGLPTEAALKLDGIVAGPGGNGCVWINGRPQHAGTDGVIRADVSAHAPHVAVLTSAEDAPMRLRVGESIDRATRRIATALPAAALHVDPPAAAR